MSMQPDQPGESRSPSSGAGDRVGTARDSCARYKYQRLRDRLRQAVQSGELSGKLPGERELARRYDANAKTVNKALCDLTTEGLLEDDLHVGDQFEIGSTLVMVRQPRMPCYKLAAKFQREDMIEKFL